VPRRFQTGVPEAQRPPARGSRQLRLVSHAPWRQRVGLAREGRRGALHDLPRGVDGRRDGWFESHALRGRGVPDLPRRARLGSRRDDRRFAERAVHGMSLRPGRLDDQREQPARAGGRRGVLGLPQSAQGDAEPAAAGAKSGPVPQLSRQNPGRAAATDDPRPGGAGLSALSRSALRRPAAVADEARQLFESEIHAPFDARACDECHVVPGAAE